MGPSLDATNPPPTAELVHAAKLLGDTGDTEGAVRAWRRVLAVEPGNLRAHQHLAAFAYHGDLPSEALGHLEAVVAQAPDDLPAWRRIAHLFELVGDFRRAAASDGASRTTWP
jgi:predicted Zn-dependent protease